MKAAGRWSEWVTAHPRLIASLALSLTLIAGMGAARLRLVSDYRTYLAPDDESTQAFAELERRFGGTDELLLVLAPADGEAQTPTAIMRVGKLADRLREMPGAVRASSIADLPLALSGEAGATLTSLGALAQAGNTEPAIWAAASASVARLATNTLLARDGSMTAAYVTVRLPNPAGFSDSQQVMDYVTELGREAEAEFAGDRILRTGTVPYYHDIMLAALRDLLILFPLCLAMAAVMLLSLLGSVRMVLACAVPVLCAVVTGVGLAGWGGVQVTAVTVIAPVLILVVSLAYVVHVADTYLQIRATEASTIRAVQLSLIENLRPTLLTVGTTALGFFSLNFSVAPPYQELGMVVAIGVAMSAVFVLTLMPVLLIWLNPPAMRDKSRFRRAVERLAERTQAIENPRTLLALGVITAGLLLCIGLNTLDDDLAEWFLEGTRLRQETMEIDQRLTGVQQIHFALPAAGDAGVHDPAYLQKVDAFAQWLRGQPDVMSVRSLPDVLRYLHEATVPGATGLPQSPALAEQLLWLYEFSAPPGDRLGGLLDDERRASLVHVSIRHQAGTALQALDTAARNWLAAQAPEFGVPMGLSAAMTFAQMALRNAPIMLMATGAVMLLSALAIGWSLRSVRLGWICVPSNLLPLGLGYGLWGLLSGHVGVALSLVAGAALGIIVDDSIHILHRYRDARRDLGMDATTACRYTVRRVGGAVTITTMVLVVGMLQVAFSSVQPNHEIGLWLAMTFALAWFCELVMLPQLLMRFDR
ncbi:MAG: efflux RND transporter permease subunit [Nevskiales bacterium]